MKLHDFIMIMGISAIAVGVVDLIKYLTSLFS